MSRRNLRIAGSVLIFATALLVYRVHLEPGSTLIDIGFETTAIADSLITHGTFADPFRLPTGPTAHLPPVYPALMAVLMKLFGTGPRGLFALQFLVTLFIAIQLALWPWISERLDLGYSTGFIATILWLVSDVARDEVWESQFVGLLTVMLALVMFLVTNRPESQRTLLICGLLWGGTLLASPVTLLVLFAWSAWLLSTRRMSPRSVLLVLLLAVGFVIPWTVRNYRTFHKFIFVRDNLPLELDVSNNDCATFSFKANLESGCFSQLHPNDNPTHAALVQKLGEIEYNHRHMIFVKWWITHHPTAFLSLTLQRAKAYWFPLAMSYPAKSSRSDWCITLANLLCLPGLLLLWRRAKPAVIIIAIWLLLFPPVYYVVAYNERYRVPVLWASFLPAAYAIVSLTRWLQSQIVAKVSPS